MNKTFSMFFFLRVYVGTYAKYNDGSIFGEWLYLSDYEDKEEFYDACRELYDDEEDPEFMFQDYENIPNGLIGNNIKFNTLCRKIF